MIGMRPLLRSIGTALGYLLVALVTTALLDLAVPIFSSGLGAAITVLATIIGGVRGWRSATVDHRTKPA